MLRNALRALKWGALALVGFVVLLVVELFLVLRRDFPLNDPQEPISGVFGDPSLPELRFVVLGDSTSVGVGTTPDKSFPWLLATRLSEQFHVELDVVGSGGAASEDLEAQVDQAIALNPDLVLVEIGANDTTHATPPWTVKRLFGNALDRLMATEAELVVAGPPDMGNIPILPEPLRTVSGLQGDNVMRIIERETLQRDVPYVDLAGGVDRGTLPPGVPYYSTDSFHPGAGGYGLWADVMYPKVAEAAERTTVKASEQGGRAEG